MSNVPTLTATTSQSSISNSQSTTSNGDHSDDHLQLVSSAVAGAELPTSFEVDQPPQYDERGRLVRTTPVKSDRYDLPRRARTSHRPIPPGPSELLAHNDRPSPPGWHKMVHPEGQLYFYQPASRVVTEAYLHDPLILSQIVFWVDRVKQLAMAQTIELPLSSELFLELDDPNNSCKYYLLNHSTRGLFWLDGGTTDELELPAVSSSDHMRLLMEEQYWNHVEFFPNHIKLSPNVESEVRAMLAHSAADAFTSNQSTAPYTFEQCQNFLSLIGSLPTTPESNAFKNCILARLMAEFASNRFVNHSGERSARLSRGQSLLEQPERQTNLSSRVLYKLCFGIPERHEQQLDGLWIDEISFSVHWRKFIQQMTAEWREQAMLGFALAILDALFLLVPETMRSDPLSSIAANLARTTGLVSETLSLACVIIAIALTRRHDLHMETHALDASDYFEHAKHNTLGFQPLAIIYSTPGALLLWTFIFTIITVLLLPWRLGGPIVGIVVLCAAALMGVILYFIQTFFHIPTTAQSDTAPQWFSLARIWSHRSNGYSEIPAGEV